jgi:hypothetical protein
MQTQQQQTATATLTVTFLSSLKLAGDCQSGKFNYFLKQIFSHFMLAWCEIALLGLGVKLRYSGLVCNFSIIVIYPACDDISYIVNGCFIGMRQLRGQMNK